MATKKPKTSSKSNKAKTNKPKTAAKTVEKPVSEAPKTNKVEKTEVKAEVTTEVKSEVKSETKPEAKSKGESCFKGFFSKKYNEKESVLTVFKDHKFYGALLGEIIGTFLLTLLLFSYSLMGVSSLPTFAIVLVAILVAVYAFSGACLNPIVTAGMMASRRMSVIRGVMYIIAEIIGAWLGWLIFNSFHLVGGEMAYDVPSMAAIGEGQFWTVAMIELLGAVIIAFFFARALKYKRSAFTFGAVVAGGVALAFFAGFIISAAFAFVGSQGNNFIFNPAAAMMYQIFPTSGENFGEIIGGVMQALSAYAFIPMIGGICGFYLSDFTSKLNSEE